MRLRTVGLLSALLLAGCKNVSLHVPLTDRDLSVTPQQAASLAWVQQLCQQSVAFVMTRPQQQVCLSEAANHRGGGTNSARLPAPNPAKVPPRMLSQTRKPRRASMSKRTAGAVVAHKGKP